MTHVSTAKKMMSHPNVSNRKVKAIIFDCDGTLVDSEGAHFEAWEKALSPYGHKLSLQDRRHFIGVPDTSTAKRLIKTFPSLTEEELRNQKNLYFATSMQHAFPPIEGTVGFVRRLILEKDHWGLKLAVASAAPKHEILTHLRHLGIENAFDLILSGQEDLTDYSDPEGVNKPKPYIYQHAAKLLGITPAECVVFEDSVTGITAAVKAGCFTIAIPAPSSASHDFSSASLRLETLAHLSVADLLKKV